MVNIENFLKNKILEIISGKARQKARQINIILN